MYIKDCASFLPSVQYGELMRFEHFLRENVSVKIYEQRKYTIFLLILLALTGISYYYGGTTAVQLYVWLQPTEHQHPTSPQVVWLLFKAGTSVGLMTFAFVGFFSSGLMREKVRGTTLYIHSLNASLTMFNLAFCTETHQLMFSFPPPPVSPNRMQENIINTPAGKSETTSLTPISEKSKQTSNVGTPTHLLHQRRRRRSESST